MSKVKATDAYVFTDLPICDFCPHRELRAKLDFSGAEACFSLRCIHRDACERAMEKMEKE